MDKPINPYRKGTVVWKVMQGSLDAWPEGGWADLTTEEIAEVLGSNVGTVRGAIGDIRRDTGYCVQRIDGRGRRYGYE